MKTIIIIIIVGFVLYRLFSRSTRGSSKTKTPKITVKTSTQEKFERKLPDSGSIQQSEKWGWVINPKSPFPLTILDTDKNTVSRMKQIFDNLWNEYDREAKEELVAIVAQSNLRCKEIDDYVVKYKPKYIKMIDALKKEHPDWADSSELDKEDLMVEFQEIAVKQLDMLPCDRVDTWPILTLFHDQPKDATIDDALIDRYGFELINFYFRFIDKLQRIYKISADDSRRKQFESFVKVGLAKRGADIPIKSLLTTLKLKDMNEMITDPNLKKFRRKADAIDFLSEQPDIKDKLSKSISFRELFQVQKLPSEFSHIDLDEVAKSWRHAEAVATIINDTYYGGQAYLDQKESLRGMTDIKGWEIYLNEDAPPYCKKVAERVSTAKRIPKLPAHIGCTCKPHPKFEWE